MTQKQVNDLELDVAEAKHELGVHEGHFNQVRECLGAHDGELELLGDRSRDCDARLKGHEEELGVYHGRLTTLEGQDLDGRLAHLVDPVTGDGQVRLLHMRTDGLVARTEELETKADVLMLRTNVMGGILLVLTGLGALARLL